MRAILATLLAAMLVVGTACDRDEAASTATDDSSQLAQRSKLEAIQPPYGAFLIDAISGRIEHVEVERGFSDVFYVAPAGVEQDGSIWTRRNGVRRWLWPSEGGVPVPEPVGSPNRCVDLGGERFRVASKEYAGRCDSLAPGGEYLFYIVHLDKELQTQFRRYEPHALRLSDASDILFPITVFLGSHGPPPATWSPSARFVIFADAPVGRATTAYLGNVETGDAAVIQRPVADKLILPIWSPARDEYLWLSQAEVVTLTDARSGHSVEFPSLKWPADFDISGRFVYTAGSTETVIAAASSGAEIARWSGAPRFYPQGRGIGAYEGDPVAGLEMALGCGWGVLVRHPLLGDPVCFAESASAAWDQSATRLALARVRGDVVRPRSEAMPSGFKGDARWALEVEWEVLLFDARSGSERELLRGIKRPTDSPPTIRWTADGKWLLVMWPDPDSEPR